MRRSSSCRRPASAKARNTASSFISDQATIWSPINRRLPWLPVKGVLQMCDGCALRLGRGRRSLRKGFSGRECVRPRTSSCPRMVLQAERGRAFARPVTLREVASAAGVSVATASKALNDTGRMTVETRERVRQTARRWASAQWLGAKPAAPAELHRRPAHQRYLWPVLPAAHVGHLRSAR